GLSLFRQSFFSGSRSGGSKVYMHRLLERAPAPTLWVLNDASAVSKALLRRMMFALELRPPTAAVREQVWKRQLEHHGIEAGPDEAHALAREFAATPGVAAGATAAAQIAGGGIDTVRLGVRGLSRVLSCEAPPQGAPPLFDPALIRADTDPVVLADSLAASGERRFSLSLQGPPGTGKSAYVRYLAERMGIEVMQKRASDLKSMWVGGTEKLVAAAFAEARDTGAFLIFDEADSLLADRRGAERSWEVSQVNEMLTWMESHPLPFACTTNFGEHLDAATLRRFVFKVALDYLSPAQAEAAFRTYFGLAPPAGIATLRDLLARLREAITTCHIVEVRYLSQSTGRHSSQRIEPYGLLYGNRPFLVGRTDWKSKHMRLWRLSNMSEARVTSESFARNPGFDLESYARRSFGTFQEEPVDVVLCFTPEAKRDAAAFLFHPSQAMEENANGTLTVRFTAGGIDEMCWHLVTWGDSVTVEHPTRLRQRLADICSGLSRHHGVTGILPSIEGNTR
ncbi:MAG: WYL domain-containing protein, partial [Rhodospirillales bacterium]|nr:WYL domain-containing protein [Rhodospirillales bacterium]